MKITVLVDNNSRVDNYLFAEPALSLLVETEKHKILFDTGYSNIIIKNAQKLKINLNDLTDIILSHGHNDHTGGLRYLALNNKNIKLTAHPNIFDSKYESDGTPYGCPVTKVDLESSYTLNLTDNVYYLNDKILYLGQIEGNSSDDIDDSALVIITEKGLFVITGCSHSGIINIIEYAKKITGINSIYGVIGGFHLLDMPEDKLEAIGDYLNKEKIDFIAPCHCCDLKSKIVLSRKNNIKEICVGDIIQILSEQNS